MVARLLLGWKPGFWLWLVLNLAIIAYYSRTEDPELQTIPLLLGLIVNFPAGLVALTPVVYGSALLSSLAGMPPATAAAGTTAGQVLGATIFWGVVCGAGFIQWFWFVPRVLPRIASRVTRWLRGRSG